VTCVSAQVETNRALGVSWDPRFGPPNGDGPEPDPFCSFRIGPNVVARTSTKMDTLAPVWNESITPASRFTAQLLGAQSTSWSIAVTDDDGTTSPGDPICQVSPQLTETQLASGTVTFTGVDSCIQLVIGFECASS
jgi:hypothetical protein